MSETRKPELRAEIDNIEKQIEDGEARQEELNSLLITRLKEFNEIYESQEVSDERQEERQIDDESYRKMKESAIEVSAMQEGYGMNVYGAILRLREYNAMGKSVYMDINGTRVYSCDVTTMNNGCKAFRGRTWDESKDQMSELDEAKIKYFIARGQEYIYPEKMGEWKEFVDVIAREMHGGIYKLDLVLDLMEKLESGTEISEVKKLYGNHNQGVRKMILHFAKRGPEFYESTSRMPLTEEEKEELAYRRAENERLEEKHRTDTREELSNERQAEEAEIRDMESNKKTIEEEIARVQEELEATMRKAQELIAKLGNLNQQRGGLGE